MTNYNYKEIEKLMEIAYDEALLSAATGDVPVGALVIDESMNIVAKAHNTREALNIIHGHAEINVINQCLVKGCPLDKMSIVVSLEPCPMCTQAICDSGIKTVFYGAPNYTSGGFGTIYNIAKNSNIDFYGGFLSEKCGKLLTDFFKSNNR